MRLIKLTTVETVGAADGFIRRHDTNFKQRFIDKVADLTEDATRVTPLRLAKVASEVIVPGDKVSAYIPGGWDEKRIMFAMIVEIANSGHSARYEYIVGHTDYNGYSLKGDEVIFDRNMKLYFNSITRVHLTEAVVGKGTAWQPKIDAHDQVLNRIALVGEGRDRRDTRPGLLRPTDLFRRSGTDKSFGSFLEKSSGRVHNLTGGFAEQIVSNNRSNNDPTLYLARNLKAYLDSASNPADAFIDDNDQADIIETAVDRLDENLPDTDPYLEEIRRDSNILRSGYVTWGELEEMNPDYDFRRQRFYDINSRRKGLRRHGLDIPQCDRGAFRSDEPESIAATLIAQSLPTIMINSMYSLVRNLIINTRARVGEDKVVCSQQFPFVDGLETSASLNYFESTIEDILLPQLTNGGVFEIDAKINANIDQDIEIWISIDGGEEAYFVFPTFADALLSPVLANDIKTVDLVSKGVMELAAGLSTERARRRPSHVDTPRVGLALRDDDDRNDRRDVDRDGRNDSRDVKLEIRSDYSDRRRDRKDPTDW